MIRAGIYQSDEPALAAARNEKCACKIGAVELLVAFPVGDLP
jgi:hypothetical protein